jgi:hypothetical protein
MTSVFTSAMDNLTFSEQVIREHPTEPMAPLAGHVVVVFEHGAQGEEICYEIRDGKRPPARPFDVRRVFGERPRLQAFAVTSERQRRITTPADVRMDVALHEVPLNIDIVYNVSEPGLLASRRDQDPLKRVRDEAVSLIRPQIAQRDWSRVRDAFRAVEGEVVAAVLGRLQRFASDYGLVVQEIVLNHRLEKEAFGDIAAVQAAKLQELEDALAFERDQRRAEYEGRLDVGKKERTIASQDVTTAAAGYLRYSAIADAAVRSAIKAIESAGESIHTPGELARAVATIRDAIEAMRDLSNGNGRALASSAPAGAIAGSQSGAGAVIATLFAETEQMSWPVTVKQQLQGATLHLIAELISPDATDGTVTEYRERLSDVRASSSLVGQQADYFNQYIDSDQLRRRLA